MTAVINQKRGAMAEKDFSNLLMNSIPGGVCELVYDQGLTLQYANEGMFAMMQMSAEEFEKNYQNRYDKLLNPEDWKEMQNRIRESIATGHILHMEYPVHHRSRKEEWRMMQAVVMERNGKPLMQCVVMDISGIKRANEELAEEQEKLKVIAEMSGDLIFVYDIANDCMDYTAHEECLKSQQRIRKDYTKTIGQNGYVHPDDQDTLKRFCEELQMGSSHIYEELRKRYADGRYHWIEIEGKTIYNKNGKPVKVIGRTNNIDERKAKEEHFRICSETDSLTGLYNHQVVMDKIRKEISNPASENLRWLIIFDVDNFKQVNDRNGHLVGDAVLCMFADELKSSLQNSLLGRIGGDEFMAYVKDMPREELEEVLKKLNTTMQGVYKDEEVNLMVSCSAGVVHCSAGCTFDELFEWADYALYRVKRESKNGYYIVEAHAGEHAPEIGYLTREDEEEYIREEAVIHNADELVFFALELLDGVSDVQSGIKMVSDRICSFFDIDDIAYVANEGGTNRKRYHWSREKKRQTDGDFIRESHTAWQMIWSELEKNATLVLQNDLIREMPGEQVQSTFFVRPDKTAARECIVFVDRRRNRDWKEEKDGLVRIAGVLYNHLKQVYDIEQKKDEIDRQMNYDSVTDLPQYHKFIQLTEQYRYERGSSNLYFVYSDFANFQFMNELYGYAEGDKILRSFAQKLQDMPGGLTFCRITSDHFVGLVRGTGVEQVQESYLALTQEFCKETNAVYDQSNLFMISGLSAFDDGNEAVSVVIDRANIARKYGKNNASTVVQVYNQEIKEKNEAQKAITANMATALENGEFKAWLQPKVSLTTGKVVGAEALVRWCRPDGSMVYPDQFIPVFEQNGFITKIDFEVLDQVLNYLRDAMDHGEEVVTVSVNFSRRHSENPNCVEQIVERLQEKRIPSKYLEAEVTESIFILDLTTLTSNLHKLKQNGIAISIDDFGSGYSSLNVLANVEADVIKLDKKFLSDIGKDSKAPVFIKYLIKMMKRMGYEVIAEGVETEEQLRLLRNADCDMVQGYYYARPMPISDFRTFLKEFNKQA